MQTEKVMVEFVQHFPYEEIPADVLSVVKNVVLTVCGTIIAGAKEEGIKNLYEYYKGMGGTPEASVFMLNDKLPADNAALVNAAMARALDFCDAMVPGLHMGSTAVPVALACSEIKGNVSGKDFLAAMTVGLEIGSRLNLNEAAYNGFDPTGIVAGFVATSIASRILGLTDEECLNALGLCFNRAGGSFQSNIDGTLAVRVIQGWTAQSGIMCARYAKCGITGPKNFLEGIYGFYHLYGKNLFSPEDAVENLGQSFLLKKTVFKKYPACGATQSSIEGILSMIRDYAFDHSDVEKVSVEVTPYVYRLVGHKFRIGDNPRVDAQFNIRYCVASALLRKDCKLEHFEAEVVKDPSLIPLIEKIEVIPSEELDKIDHTAMRMQVRTKHKYYQKEIDVAPGFPGNPLSQEEHVQRFLNLVEYAGMEREKAEEIVKLVSILEERKNALDLVQYFQA